MAAKSIKREALSGNALGVKGKPEHHYCLDLCHQPGQQSAPVLGDCKGSYVIL